MPTKKSWDTLATLNHHPRDDRIEFQEEGHRYKIDGHVEGWISATSLLSSLHSPFDADKAATSLINGKRYKNGTHPLSGKSKDEIIKHWAYENKRGTALHARMELGMQGVGLGYENGDMGGIDGAGVGMDATHRVMLSTVNGIFEGDDTHRISLCEMTREVFIKYPFPADVPLASVDRQYVHIGFLWDDDTVRRNRHDEAELGDEEPILGWSEAINEALQIKEFWEKHAFTNHLIPFRSEWVIWDEDYKIAGTIDAIMKNNDTGGYWIYDWKRVSNGLEPDIEASRYGYRPQHDEWLAEIKPWVKKMNEPVSELYDTKYWHYSLQLNLYRSILERHYGLKIEGMMLVQIHPSLGGVRCHEVVRLDDPISRVLETRKIELETMSSE